MSLLTKRFPTILGLLILGAAVAAYFYYFNPTLKQSSPEIVPAKVRITNIADNKFSVSWTTSSPTIGEVEYGQVGEKLTNKARDDRDTNDKSPYSAHHVTIEGLQPNTQYAFRILSGDNLTRFDNNGSPYTTTTGPVIGATPTSENFYGVVQLPTQQAAQGTLVYLTLPGAATASTLVNGSGNYAFTLSTIRKGDLRSYVEFDPSATIASLTVESGTSESIVSVNLANSDPVPTITLGQDSDFLNQPQQPTIAEVVPEQSSPTPSPIASSSAIPTPQTPSIFNVEPIQPVVDEVSTTKLSITNPKEAGETLSTLRPEFRGTGPKGTILTVALTGQKAISDTTVIASDGTWDWAPVIDLRAGAQTITVSYTPEGGVKQQLSRAFVVSSTPGLEPAFVSTPSATVATPTPLPTLEPEEDEPSPTPRAAMPATDSGVPVTGVIENTLLTAAIGIVIMVIGAALLSL